MLAAMVCLIVFCTAYVSVLPAMALEQETEYASESNAGDEQQADDKTESSESADSNDSDTADDVAEQKEVSVKATVYADDTYEVEVSDAAEISLKGELPEDIVAKAYPYEKEIALDDDSQKVIEAYDIGLFVAETDKDGNETEKEYQPESAVEVTISSDKLSDVEKVDVYHIADDASAPEKVQSDVEVNEGAVKFSADEFSAYVLTAAENKKDSDSSDPTEDIDNGGISPANIVSDGTNSFIMNTGDVLDMNGYSGYDNTYVASYEDGWWWNQQTHTSNSSDTNVAALSIDKDGKATVTAVGEGTATVTLYYETRWGHDSVTLNIMVLPKGHVKLDFNTNGGSGSVDSMIQQAGDTVTLPDYSGTRSGYTFVGWTETPNAAALPSATYFKVYQPGTEYTVESNTTLYAVWQNNNNTSTNAYFYIRTDGTIPYEPGAYPSAVYTQGIEVKDAINVQYWVTDSDAKKPIAEGQNYVANDVANVLSNFPSDEQIKAAYPNYDPDTQYVLWYVQKYGSTAGNGINYNYGYNFNGWHIDGVILDRTKVSISYDPNVPSGVTTVPNVPLGYQVAEGTEVSVGESGNVDSGNYNNASPSIAGYTFIGWNTKRDGSGTTYQNRDKLLLKENTTLYAQWSSTGNALQLRKVDNTDTVINGAEFTIREAGGTETAFTAGTYTNKNIKTNTIYTVKETKAPDGYDSLKNDFSFIVKSDGTEVKAYLCNDKGNELLDTNKPNNVRVSYSNGTVHIDVVNYPGKLLPKTGGIGTGLYTAGGLMLMSFAVVCVLWERRHKTGDI